MVCVFPKQKRMVHAVNNVYFLKTNGMNGLKVATTAFYESLQEVKKLEENLEILKRKCGD